MKDDPDYQPSQHRHFHRHIYALVYKHENQAIRIVEHLIRHDFLMDQIALLGKRLSKGDDVLGIYYPSPTARVKQWAKYGVLWGGAWGLVAGLAGMLITPNPDKEVSLELLLKGSTAAVLYGVLVGGSVAIAAAITNVANALHRMGVPRDQIKFLHEAIRADKHVIILQGSREELERFKFRIEHSGAELFLEFAKDRMEG